MVYNFDVKAVVNGAEDWLKKYMEETGGKSIILGISGGKDSAVVLGLCVRAGIPVATFYMPDTIHYDFLSDYKKAKLACETFGCYLRTIPVSISADSFRSNVYEVNKNEALINLLPRIRTTLLYYIAQAEWDNARVANCSNMSEIFVGYSTLWGDSVGDFSLLGDLTVEEVIAVGREIGVPEEILMAAPDDGLSGMTDEEKLGVSYKDIEKFIRYGYDAVEDIEVANKIWNLNKKNRFKSDMIHLPTFELKSEWIYEFD